MKIIDFPNGTARVKAVGSNDPTARLSMGPVSFTCTACNATSTADFSKMIFRSIEFYCRDCGAYYRISNPAFNATAAKPRR